MNSNFTWERSSLVRIAFQGFLALGALTLASSASALVNDSAEYTFNLPSTATNSQNPPYEVIATLTLTEDANGVIFTLDPNEDNVGFDSPDHSRIITLDVAFFLDATTTPLVWSQVSGSEVKSLEWVDATNIDSGYAALDDYINIDFFSANNADDNDRFFVELTSSWRIDGVTIEQFTGTSATSKPKPSPIFGVISVAPFSSDPQNPPPPPFNQPPNSSNWVAGALAPTMVPEPTNLALLGIGLIGFVFARRRHARG